MQKEEKKSTFKRIQLVLGYPMLVIHELWHVLFAILLGVKITRISLYNPFVDTEISGAVYYNIYDYNTWYKTRRRLHYISLAPIMSIMLAIFFSFYSIWGVVFLIYNVLYIKTSLPSVTDLYYVFLKKENGMVSYIWELEMLEYFASDETEPISDDTVTNVNTVLEKENQLSFFLNILIIKKEIKQIISNAMAHKNRKGIEYPKEFMKLMKKQKRKKMRKIKIYNPLIEKMFNDAVKEL